MTLFTEEEMERVSQRYNLRTADGIQNAVKELTRTLLQTALESEMEETLGYERYDTKNKATDNARNGYSKKTVQSEMGPIELDIPRDRQGEHEAILVPKHTRRLPRIEEQVMALFARGNSDRDIRDTLHELYGVELSAQMISRITEKLNPEIAQWQSRPLEKIYTIVYLDALNLTIRHEGKTSKRAVYLALGIDCDGQKDVLGIWICQTETSKFWLSVLTDLKNRGVKTILICSVDGLSGFDNAINSVFPSTRIQRCIVHQIRYSCKYVNYKDRKEFCADMKAIYTASTEELALQALVELDEKWGAKYAYAIKSWQDNWSDLATFFQFSPEIRRLIYTTNPIESLNSTVKKYTSPKRLFPSDDAAMKSIYCAINLQTKKWGASRIKDWGSIFSQLQIAFSDQFPSIASSS